MKTKLFSIIAFAVGLPCFAADEFIMQDDKKRDVEVMMFQAGKFLVFNPDGKREIVPIADIKEATFEAPEDLMNTVKLASGEMVKFVVNSYNHEGFYVFLDSGDDKTYAADQIAAIKFRNRTSYTGGGGAPAAAAGKGGGAVVPGGLTGRRIVDEQIPDIAKTLTMDVPSKLVDSFVEVMELKAELDVLDADLSGSKSVESKKTKILDEMKKQGGAVRELIKKETEKASDQVEKMKEQIEKLDARFVSASEKGSKDAEALYEEKLQLVAEQKNVQEVINAFNGSFTGFIDKEKPARDSMHELWGRPAPTGSMYVFGPGHMRFDKKTRKGVTMLCFWSTQNRESQKVMKLLASLLAEYPKGELTVYTVNVGDRLETLKKVMPQLPRVKGMYHAIDVIDDKEKTLVANYRIALLPSFVLIDGQGKVNSAQVGYSRKWPEYFETRLEPMFSTDDVFGK